MHSFRYVLVPALVAACSNPSGDTTATESTVGTETTTETSTGDANTDAPTTTDGPSTMTTGTETDGDTTTTSTTAVDPTEGPTTDSTTTTTTDSTTTTTDSSTTDSTTTTTDSTTTTTDSTTTDSTSSTTDDTTTTTTGEPAECESGEMQSCYSGPPGSEDIGLCKAGVQTCQDDQTWGPCDGEVLPAPESCDSPGDEDCDGIDPCAGDGDHLWSRVAGGASIDEGVRVAFDGAGNLVLAARSIGDIDLGGGTLTAKGGYDVLLAKYSPTGQHLWSKRFGDGFDQGNGAVRLAVTSAGDIALAGDFRGTLDFGGGPLVNENAEDAFLARFDGDGAHVWSKSFIGTLAALPYQVAFDAGGNLLLGGSFSGTFDVGGGPLASAGSSDAFVAKFTSAGAHVWSQRFGDATTQYVQGLATDGAGNVYITGGFQGTMNPGNGPLVSAGNEDIFLVRYAANGNASWAKRFGDGTTQIGRGLAIDGAGRVTIGGEMAGNVDFGGGPVSSGALVGFVAQFESDGDHRWSKLLATVGGPQPLDIATDGLGNVLVTGYFVNIADFGGGPLASDGSGDVFLLKLAPSGTHVWSQRFGDFMDQSGLGVAGSATGRVGVTGRFRGGINLGDGPKNAQGTSDLFVGVFSP